VTGAAIARLDAAGLKHGPGNPSAAPGVHYAPDGRTVCVAVGHDAIRLFDANTGRTVGDLSDPEGMVSFILLAYSPDGAEIATTGWDRRLTRWDARTGRRLEPRHGWEGGASTTLSYSADGRYLYCYRLGDDDGQMPLVIDRATGGLWEYQKVLSPDAVSRDGRLGLARGRQLVELPGLRPIGRPLPAGVELRAYSPDGRIFFTERSGFTDPSDEQEAGIRVWDTASSRPLGPPVASCRAGFNFDPMRNRLVTTGHGETHLEHWRYEPASGSPERLMIWAETETAHQLDGRGVPRPLSPGELAARRERLAALGGSPLPTRP
jgi:WD40 repeat protein